MIVIEFGEIHSECWFSLSTNPGRANKSKVGLYCTGWYRGRGSNEMSAYRGVGVYEQKFSSSASRPFFFLVLISLKDFLNRG